MNITFLIGNGFDLNLELNTRFSDFIKIYHDINDDDPRIIRFKNALEKTFNAWSDFEVWLGEYTDEYKNNEQGDLIYCLNNFIIQFSDYLKNEENRVNYQNNSDEIVSVFTRSICKYYSHLPTGRQNIITSSVSDYLSENWEYNFITFNYTDVLRKCLDVLKEKKHPVNTHKGTGIYEKTTYNEIVGQIIHIHGTTIERMIMGVDNETQIKNEEYRSSERILQMLIKPQMNDYLQMLNDQKATRFINESKIVCIFGMSIGETDLSWWKTISAWLQGDDDNQLIIFWWDENYSRLSPYDIYDNDTEIRDKFFRLTEFPEEKQSEYVRRIHVAINSDMFKVNLLYQENTDKT